MVNACVPTTCRGRLSVTPRMTLPLLELESYSFGLLQVANNQVEAYGVQSYVINTCANHIVYVRPLQTFEHAALCTVPVAVRSRLRPRWRFGIVTGMNRPVLAHAMSTQIKPIDPVVFYDPHAPGRSCLVTGSEETTLSVAIIGSVIGVVLNPLLSSRRLRPS